MEKETKIINGVTFTRFEGDIQWVAHEDNEEKENEDE